MNGPSPFPELEARLASLDEDRIRTDFEHHNEMLVLEDVVPEDIYRTALKELWEPAMASSRSRWPWVRRGSTVGYSEIRTHAPTATALYESDVFTDFASRLAGKPLYRKSRNDEHALAAYVYRRAGDYLANHYDTCGCGDGGSYTMVISLINDSSQRLLCTLDRDDPHRRRDFSIATTPGMAVFFCGSRVWHGVTPMAENETRVMLSLSWSTATEMPTKARLGQNAKDAILYFGPRALFQRNYGRWDKG